MRPRLHRLLLRGLSVLLLGTAFSARLAVPLDAQVRWPSEGPPRPLAARGVNFPPYELRTFDNGLQVVAVLHHEQPVVSMRLIVRAGAALDPRGKAGLANLAASLLDQGTTTRSAREMNDDIDFMGGAMGAGAGTDLTFVNVVVMKDSFQTGLRMLSDMTRHPAFAGEEIERQRQQAISGLQVSFSDPEFVADAVFDRLVYGFHPYGMPQGGTPETLASLSRADLVAFDVGSLSIFGSFARDEAREDSDVDVLVEFAQPVGLLQFIRLRRFLEGVLGRRVDLATAASLKERIRARVAAEAVRAA